MKPHWSETKGKLEATFIFADFAEALSFVNRVGEVAERHGHHPDICIQDYNRVIISTTTHDAGGTVTGKDRSLAEAVDELAN